jgi:protein-disulfide isomerase
MVDTLFANQRSWAYVNGKSFVATLGGYARLAGMTGEEYNKCLNNKELHEGLLNQRRDSARKYNIRSTPTFIIGNKRIEGARSFEVFKEVIDPLVEAAARKKPMKKEMKKPAAKMDGGDGKKDDAGKK